MYDAVITVYLFKRVSQVHQSDLTYLYPVPTIVLGTGVKISKSVLTKNSHFLSKRNLSLENHEGAKLNTTEIAATAYLTRPVVLKHVQTLNS